MKYKITIGPLQAGIEPEDSNQTIDREIYLTANLEANSPDEAAKKAASALSVAIEGFQMTEPKPNKDMIPMTPLQLKRFR